MRGRETVVRLLWDWRGWRGRWQSRGKRKWRVGSGWRRSSWDIPGRRWGSILGLPPWADGGGHKLDGVRKECKGAGKKELFWGNTNFVDSTRNAPADTVQSARAVSKPGDTRE